MFEQSQEIIHSSYEKILKLEDVLVILAVHKVKPKALTKKNTRVNNVYGSKEGQNILEKFESIDKEKNEIQHQKEQKAKQKVTEKELFYNCKDK